MSGEKAVGPLVAALEQYGNPNVAAGAALVLGSMRAKGAGPVIVDALRKGSVGAYYGLRALADLGDPTTVPTVLEFLSDSNAVVRRQAVATVGVLVDPARHDGRAVEPLVSALHASKMSEEREQLARALGRTGSPRAIPELRALLKVTDLTLRVAAIDALGEIGPAGQEGDLVGALGDDNPSVRLQPRSPWRAPEARPVSLGSSIGSRNPRPRIEPQSESRSAARSRSREGAVKQLEPVLFGQAAV
jgi:HEAT repeat protein